jgi:hypothetical protein
VNFVYYGEKERGRITKIIRKVLNGGGLDLEIEFRIIRANKAVD